MILISDIRKAVIQLMRKTGIGYVTGEDLEQTRDYQKAIGDGGEDRDILQVLVEPVTNSTIAAGKGTNKSILVDISYMKGIDTKRSDIQNMLETIDGLIRPILHVKDRFFTIENADFNITDNIGHYVFYIRFMDGESVQIDEPFMEKLDYGFKEV